VQRATSDRPRSVIAVIVCLSPSSSYLICSMQRQVPPAIPKSQIPQNSTKITNYMPSMPPINASTGQLLRIQIDIIRSQQDKCHNFGCPKSLGEWPANGEAALQSPVPHFSSILPCLVCLPANGECILRRNQESGAPTSRSTAIRLGLWRMAS
jgi:hypothetical protein